MNIEAIPAIDRQTFLARDRDGLGLCSSFSRYSVVGLNMAVKGTMKIDANMRSKAGASCRLLLLADDKKDKQDQR